ncbi:hypothetical protein BD626DRAFT_484742 [Schizophyllum amplum]|uniref:Uncharacterized protein n=1 Tax=Schizophyllum amplum TaxID=97359 RepID=A0A550CQP3_9AGAR|nr:hypothetical protein BD626DRAFT_484742 [Auriculariopsis ampla]
MFDEDIWGFTVVRAEGLKTLRPEKKWKPIITLDVDQLSGGHRETVLGCDGQNPNLKELLHISGATMKSKVEIQVWHRSESKKKSKKRSLVGTARHSIEDLFTQQERDKRVEVRLQCQALRKKTPSKTKPSSGPYLLLRLHPPSSASLSPVDTALSGDETLMSDGLLSGYPSDAASPLASPVASEPEGKGFDFEASPGPSTLRRRRKTRGYCVDSDDAASSGTSDDELESFAAEPTIASDETTLVNDNYENEDDEDDAVVHIPSGFLYSAVEWMAASAVAILPQYTEKIDVPAEEPSIFEHALAACTVYRDLRIPHLCDFDSVHQRLRHEWFMMITILAAIAGVDAAIFAIGPDTIFAVTATNFSRTTIAFSFISSGCGMASSALLLARFNWCTPAIFAERAKDFGSDSYVCFSLSAHVPLLCMMVSSLCVMVYMASVAFSEWPMGSAVFCFLVGMIMTLQFFAFGARKLAAGVRHVRRRTMPARLEHA